MRAGVSIVSVLLAAPLVAQPPRLMQLGEPIRVQKKLALVIGNAAYQNATPLKNPINDALAMSAELRRLGFQVTEAKDLSLQNMDRVIDEFTGRLERGDFGMFYFAGHGVQVQLENYLIPVDYREGSEADIKYTAYPAYRVRDKMDYSGARLRVLILDACRTNPFRGQRSGAPGLAPMRSDAEGSYIAYAAADNQPAADNPRENNGLYTKHLIESLRAPGLHLKEIFEQAKKAVFTASGRKQQPYTYDGIVGRYYFTAPAPAAAPAPAGVDPVAIEMEYWKSLDRNDAESLDGYLTRYPNGQFADIARRSLAKLRTAASSAPAVTPPVSAPKPESSIVGETRPGTVRVNPIDGLNYVWVPPGRFQMGCSPGDSECEDDEKPAHPVRISRGFWMGQTEVTVGAYKRFTQATGRSMPDAPVFLGIALNPGWANDRLPMVNVSWDDAKAYCSWAGGRLPAEAEWEYAARAGSTAARYGLLDDIGWFADNSGRAPFDSARVWREDQSNYGKRLADNGNRMHEVAGKRPNDFSLHDMLGNVWEWTADWYDAKYYGKKLENDPSGQAAGELRSVRGGSWLFYPRVLRVSDRVRYRPGVRGNVIGFRCSREGIP